MDKYLGKRLDGRYEITELIGVGGMANVYKARDVIENRVVAVKNSAGRNTWTMRNSSGGLKMNPKPLRSSPTPIL